MDAVGDMEYAEPPQLGTEGDVCVALRTERCHGDEPEAPESGGSARSDDCGRPQEREKSFQVTGEWTVL